MIDPELLAQLMARNTLAWLGIWQAALEPWARGQKANPKLPAEVEEAMRRNSIKQAT